MPVEEIDRTTLRNVCAVINSKGGVGKTTLTANIGGLLAQAGWKVLLIDMDPQGNLGIDLGYIKRPLDDDVTDESNAFRTSFDDEGVALAQALTFGSPLRPAVNVRPNLDVIPGGGFLSSAEAALSSGNTSLGNPKLALARVLADIAPAYDLVLIDCPPGNRSLQFAAACAAHFMLVPTKSDEASVIGLTITAGVKIDVMDVNPDLELLGVVLFDSGTVARNARHNLFNSVAKVLGPNSDPKQIFTSFVRHSETSATFARAKGLLVHEVEDHIAKAPKWYELRKAGQKTTNPSAESTRKLNDDMTNVVDEFITRFTELNEREAVAR